MTDPTAPTDLAAPLVWREDEVTPAFAARAAAYLRDCGLEPRAIVLALRSELGVPTAEAVQLAGGDLSPRCEREHRVTDRPRGARRPITPFPSLA